MSESPTIDMFAVGDARRVRVEAIGSELQPVIVIDNFIADPQALVELASSGPAFAAQARDFYPGLRKQVSGDYSCKLLQNIEPLIKAVFQLPQDSAATISLCAFSLATTPAHKLRPIQCVPHIDTHDPNQFAVVHYLCDQRYGGTAFYRHRSTGFETITQARFQDYFRLLKAEVMEQGFSEPGYIAGSTSLFEQIASLEVKYNRALIYRSNALHSGNIQEALGLLADPRRGRLTANSLIHFSPPADQ